MNPQPVMRAPIAPEPLTSTPSAETILEVLSKAGAVFFRWSPIGGLEFLSASPDGLLGYTREELFDDADLVKRILDPDALEELERRMPDFFVIGREAAKIELPLKARSGERVRMEARVVPELADTGAITGFLGIALVSPGGSAPPRARRSQQGPAEPAEGSPIPNP